MLLTLTTTRSPATDLARALPGPRRCGGACHDRPHSWHLEIVDRLAAADPELIGRTRRVFVDTTDPAAVAAATTWWSELTAAGGEGMVVKPAPNLTRGRARAGPARAQDPRPGVPAARLRPRLHRARQPRPAAPARPRPQALAGRGSTPRAWRRWTRAVCGEPLWRVHECVFAVLALESEPVDRRL